MFKRRCNGCELGTFGVEMQLPLKAIYKGSHKVSNACFLSPQSKCTALIYQMQNIFDMEHPILLLPHLRKAER